VKAGEIVCRSGNREDCDGDCLREDLQKGHRQRRDPGCVRSRFDNDETPDAVEASHCEPVDTDKDETPDYVTPIRMTMESTTG